MLICITYYNICLFGISGCIDPGDMDGTQAYSDNRTRTLVTFINGLVQERRNSSASAMELRLSCISHRHIQRYTFLC